MEKLIRILLLFYKRKHPAHLRICVVRLKGTLSCFALSGLILIPLWEKLIFSNSRFNHLKPSVVDYLSGLVLFALIFFLIVIIFRKIRKLPRVKHQLGIVVLGLLLAFGVFNPVRQYLSEHYLQGSFRHLFWFKTIPMVMGITFLLVAQRTQLILWNFVRFTSPFTILVVLRLLIGVVSGAGKEVTITHLKDPPVISCHSNRVVWIVFDELDYRLTFPERPKPLVLNNFDRFSFSAFRFTNAISPSSQTILSVPSLIDGLIYVAAFPNSPNKLILRDEKGGISFWGSRSNVFTDIKAAGGRAAVLGWYLPYGRIFGDTLDYSHWVAHSPERFIGLGLDLPSTLVAHLWGILPIARKSFHRNTQKELEADMERIITDPRYALCFLHLPAPHLPALGVQSFLSDPTLYFNDVRAYLSNLQVADGVLGKCLDAIDASSVSSNTTVIVSSDHPWRGSELYDGKSDPRVPFMIRFPGQKNGSDRGIPLQTVETRDLIGRIIGANAVIKNGTNLPHWKKNVFAD